MEGAEPPGDTVMWEVRAADDDPAALLAWVEAHAPAGAKIFRSADRPLRVVVLDSTGQGMPDVPAGLVARPPHAWRFVPVPRANGCNGSAPKRVNPRAGSGAGPGDASHDAPPDGPRPGAGS